MYTSNSNKKISSNRKKVIELMKLCIKGILYKLKLKEMLYQMKSEIQFNFYNLNI